MRLPDGVLSPSLDLTARDDQVVVASVPGKRTVIHSTRADEKSAHTLKGIVKAFGKNDVIYVAEDERTGLAQCGKS